MEDWEQKAKAAYDMISALCQPRGTPGARDWMMSIPARPDCDPDIVIGDALRAARQKIGQVQTKLERLRELTDPRRAMQLTAESTRLDEAYVEGWNAAMARIRIALEEANSDRARTKQ